MQNKSLRTNTTVCLLNCETMAQFQGIVNQLQNENNHHFGFGIFVPVPPLPFPELENIWEWKRHNGMPVFQDPQSGNN